MPTIHNDESMPLVKIDQEKKQDAQNPNGPTRHLSEGGPRDLVQLTQEAIESRLGQSIFDIDFFKVTEQMHPDNDNGVSIQDALVLCHSTVSSMMCSGYIEELEALFIMTAHTLKGISMISQEPVFSRGPDDVQKREDTKNILMALHHMCLSGIKKEIERMPQKSHYEALKNLNKLNAAFCDLAQMPPMDLDQPIERKKWDRVFDHAKDNHLKACIEKIHKLITVEASKDTIELSKHSIKDLLMVVPQFSYERLAATQRAFYCFRDLLNTAYSRQRVAWLASNRDVFMSNSNGDVINAATGADILMDNSRLHVKLLSRNQLDVILRSFNMKSRGRSWLESLGVASTNKYFSSQKVINACQRIILDTIAQLETFYQVHCNDKNPFNLTSIKTWETLLVQHRALAPQDIQGWPVDYRGCGLYKDLIAALANPSSCVKFALRAQPESVGDKCELLDVYVELSGEHKNKLYRVGGINMSHERNTLNVTLSDTIIQLDAAINMGRMKSNGEASLDSGISGRFVDTLMEMSARPKTFVQSVSKEPNDDVRITKVCANCMPFNAFTQVERSVSLQQEAQIKEQLKSHAKLTQSVNEWLTQDGRTIGKSVDVTKKAIARFMAASKDHKYESSGNPLSKQYREKINTLARMIQFKMLNVALPQASAMSVKMDAIRSHFMARSPEKQITDSDVARFVYYLEYACSSLEEPKFARHKNKGPLRLPGEHQGIVFALNKSRQALSYADKCLADITGIANKLEEISLSLELDQTPDYKSICQQLDLTALHVGQLCDQLTAWERTPSAEYNPRNENGIVAVFDQATSYILVHDTVKEMLLYADNFNKPANLPLGPSDSWARLGGLAASLDQDFAQAIQMILGHPGICTTISDHIAEHKLSMSQGLFMYAMTIAAFLKDSESAFINQLDNFNSMVPPSPLSTDGSEFITTRTIEELGRNVAMNIFDSITALGDQLNTQYRTGDLNSTLHKMALHKMRDELYGHGPIFGAISSAINWSVFEVMYIGGDQFKPEIQKWFGSFNDAWEEKHAIKQSQSM